MKGVNKPLIKKSLCFITFIFLIKLSLLAQNTNPDKNNLFLPKSMLVDYIIATTNVCNDSNINYYFKFDELENQTQIIKKRLALNDTTNIKKGSMYNKSNRELHNTFVYYYFKENWFINPATLYMKKEIIGFSLVRYYYSLGNMKQPNKKIICTFKL